MEWRRSNRTFFSDGGNGEFKFHLVYQNLVCSHIKLDGLGVRKLTTLDQSFVGEVLMEICWRLFRNNIYGEEWGGWTSELIRPYICNLGKGMRVG
jgi:hypothetical protein